MPAYPVTPLAPVKHIAGVILRVSRVDLSDNEANVLAIVRDGTYCATTTFALALRLIDAFTGV